MNKRNGTSHFSCWSLVAGLQISAAGLPANLHAAEPARGSVTPKAPIDFRRDIEPILVKRCSECHGPDKHKSELRLDQKSAAFRGGESGKPAIIPGKSSESELIHRVTTTDQDELMPSKGEPLTREQIELLRSWIDQGAVWPDDDPRKHWAFVKPSRPALPAVQPQNWPRNPIDHFILARLAKERLTPSPEADRATLIRRLSFDLTGLPPSIAEVDAFERDNRPGAYDELVDRLLASPRFGENVGRWWLDLARYADSNGYQVDLARSIWPYRDWVIDAFNRNMPFDQFTIEQLAGDLLPNATLEQKIATGFNRNTKINDEGGGDAEEYRTKAVKDRVATTATTWLGLTMMCAECHSHKYDPISHEEYYRFYAFFNNTTDGGNYSVEPTLAVPAPWQGSQHNYLRICIANLQHDLAKAEAKLPAEQAAWEKLVSAKGNVWRTLELANVISTGGSSYTNMADRSVLGTGLNPIYDTITFESATDLEGITAVLLEVLPDESLPKKGPGRWGQTGNFILDEFAMWATPALAAASSGSAKSSTNVFFSTATADWDQQYYLAEHAVDRNPKTGWAIGPKFGQRHFLIAELKEPLRHGGGFKVGFKFDSYHGNSHAIGRWRVSLTSEPDRDALWPVPDEMRRLVAVPAAERTDEQKQRLSAYYRTVSPTIRRLERELIRFNQRESELASAKYTTLVMQERTEPRVSYVHVRGNFLEKGKEVTPGVPAILAAPSAGPLTNRLALARWLVDSENPLTARVTVNRIWERIFGTGIVKTSEDFGKQGEAPTHPELLDWLATEFVNPTAPPVKDSKLAKLEADFAATLQRFSGPVPRPDAPAKPHGWDVKHLIRLIVTSATYRQSAAADATKLEKDLYNRLLARGPRFRMDAEMIRDNALAVSGLLNQEIMSGVADWRTGGPSAYPRQVANLWKEIGFLRPEIGMDEWPTSEGPDSYRRGIYTFWRRVCTYPTFATFDAPSREVCVSRRPRTNTPLQALAGLNEPTLLEAARALAERILREGGDTPAQQMEFAFKTVLSRPPTAAEHGRLLALLDQQMKSFQQDRKSAEALVKAASPGLSEEWEARRLATWMRIVSTLDLGKGGPVDVRHLAAWMIVANVLLNLDETITKG